MKGGFFQELEVGTLLFALIYNVFSNHWPFTQLLESHAKRKGNAKCGWAGKGKGAVDRPSLMAFSVRQLQTMATWIATVVNDPSPCLF